MSQVPICEKTKGKEGLVRRKGFMAKQTLVDRSFSLQNARKLGKEHLIVESLLLTRHRVDLGLQHCVNKLKPHFPCVWSLEGETINC